MWQLLLDKLRLGLRLSGSRTRSDHAACQLAAMSDLELRDLGVGRSEIPAFSSQVASPRGEDIQWGNRL
ncbi:DUF1127 domain-containing protein [Undibacterium sp. Di27W]|uniref:DUF1127 domain-containing protein n=1 Tax=Undibacterium sp. Di27W TaxID=3413036 RepID=UPI003BEFF0DB